MNKVHMTKKEIIEWIEDESHYSSVMRDIKNAIDNLHYSESYYEQLANKKFADQDELEWFLLNKAATGLGVFNDEWLVTARVKKLNLTITNIPLKIRKNGNHKFHDPHWLAVLVMNFAGEHKGKRQIPPTTIDYLEYINAKDGWASLYNLPKQESFVFHL